MSAAAPNHARLDAAPKIGRFKLNANSVGVRKPLCDRVLMPAGSVGWVSGGWLEHQAANREKVTSLTPALVATVGAASFPT